VCYAQLFSSGLAQLGENQSGLWGFVEADILKEARRAHFLVIHAHRFLKVAYYCVYCDFKFYAQKLQYDKSIIVSVQSYCF